MCPESYLRLPFPTLISRLCNACAVTLAISDIQLVLLTYLLNYYLLTYLLNCRIRERKSEKRLRSVNDWNKTDGKESGKTVTKVEVHRPVSVLLLDPSVPGLSSPHPFSATMTSRSVSRTSSSSSSSSSVHHHIVIKQHDSTTSLRFNDFDAARSQRGARGLKRLHQRFELHPPQPMLPCIHGI